MEGKADDAIKGFITVRLTTSDSSRAGAIAMSIAQQGIEHSDIATVTALAGSKAAQVVGGAVSHSGGSVILLESVVSQLALLVRIVDQAAKASVVIQYEAKFI